MLEEFEAALERLRTAARAVDSALGDGQVRPLLRMRLGSAAHDVIELAAIFREDHFLAVSAHQERTRRLASSPTLALRMRHAEELQGVPFEQWGPILERQLKESVDAGIFKELEELPSLMALADAPTARLKADYKGLAFAVRVLQDEVYRVLLELLPGTASGAGSMNRALTNSCNPVHLVVSQACPSYFDWFRRWRDLRNRLKYGTAFTIRGPDEDLGIAFAQITDEGGLTSDLSVPAEFRLSDITRALDESACVLEVARSINPSG